MARTGLVVLLTLTGALAASPAAAQFPNIFDSIFGNPPARPPADVPSRPPASVPSEPEYIPPGGLPPGPPPGSRYQTRQTPPNQFPGQQQRYPTRQFPSEDSPDSPIQTQPLPPPPGAAVAPPGSRVQPPASPAAPPPDQRQQQQRAPTPAPSGPPPTDEVIVEPPPHKIPNPSAVFSGLDKITGRIISFDVAINETVRFGALEVTPRACYTRPPTETPNTDGFVEVDELTLQGELKRIFNGWMFAASPGLNAVEHPIYDVWLTDCKGAPQPTVAEAPAAPAAAPTPAPAPRATQQPRRTPQQPSPQPLPPPPR
jgi:hypothetical protein